MSSVGESHSQSLLEQSDINPPSLVETLAAGGTSSCAVMSDHSLVQQSLSADRDSRLLEVASDDDEDDDEDYSAEVNAARQHDFRTSSPDARAVDLPDFDPLAHPVLPPASFDAKNVSPESAASEATGGDTSNVPQSMRLRNLYVANLPQGFDVPRLKALFSPFGDVHDVKLLLDIATGYSRGIAFVMFGDPASARLAIAELHQKVVDEKVLHVRFSEKGADRIHNKTASPYVFMRNVPAASQSGDVTRYGSQYGRVVKVTPHSQSCQEGGPSPYNAYFVEFENANAAEEFVLSIDGKAPFNLPWADHPLVVAKLCRDHEQLQQEMRKSIILSNRFARDGATPSPHQTVVPPLPSFAQTAQPGGATQQTAAQPPDVSETSLSFSRSAATDSRFASSLSPNTNSQSISIQGISTTTAASPGQSMRPGILTSSNPLSFGTPVLQGVVPLSGGTAPFSLQQVAGGSGACPQISANPTPQELIKVRQFVNALNPDEKTEVLCQQVVEIAKLTEQVNLLKKQAEQKTASGMTQPHGRVTPTQPSTHSSLPVQQTQRMQMHMMQPQPQQLPRSDAGMMINNGPQAQSLFQGQQQQQPQQQQQQAVAPTQHQQFKQMMMPLPHLPVPTQLAAQPTAYQVQQQPGMLPSYYPQMVPR